MKVTVECECGEQFEIEISNELYRSRGHYGESKMGKRHCTNPDCDKTVHVNANVYSCVELDEDENNPNIDWEEIEVGDVISYKGYSYEVVLKVTRKLKGKGLFTDEKIDEKINLLYLRSNELRNNLILEVRESGFLSSIPIGSLKYSALTEEEIDFLREE